LKLKNLELLSLHGILGITDVTIESLADNVNLKTLDIMGCKNIKNNSKEYLTRKFSKLECFKYHF